MKPLPMLYICLIALGSAWQAAHAQSLPPCPQAALPPATLQGAATPLAAALDAAWQRAVVARESDGRQRRADAERAAIPYFRSGPPVLDISHRDDRLQSHAGKQETAIDLAIPLWLPGQRAARMDAAEGEVAAARSAERLARLQLAGELRETAWQIATLQAEAGQAHNHAHSLQQLAEDVQRRVQAGDAARADALAAQAEHLAACAAHGEAARRLQAAQAQWTLLTGLRHPAMLDEPTATPPAEPEAGTEPALTTHPALQFAEDSVEVLRKRVVLLRHSRRDAPELSVGLRRDLGGRGERAQESMVIGVRLPFGTEERNRVAETAALAELEVARTHAQRLRERLNQELTLARTAHQVAQAQLAAEQARARLLRERARLIELSYRAGETPLPELLRTLAAAAQADNAAAQQTAALGLARARLQQAMGRMP